MIRGTAKIPAQLRYRAQVRLLRRRRQIADRHVLDHAAAKRAGLSHRKTSCLKGWVAENPRSSQTGGDYCDCPLTAAPAASFNPYRVSHSADWYKASGIIFSASEMRCGSFGLSLGQPAGSRTLMRRHEKAARW